MRNLKTIISSILLLIASTSIAAAEMKTVFDRDVVQGWRVTGKISSDAKQHDTCSAKTQWVDGSFWILAVSLTQNELRIIIHYNHWQMKAARMSSMPIGVTTYRGQKLVGDGTLDFFVSDENTVLSDALDPNKFIEMMINAERMVFTAPDNISTAQDEYDIKFGDSAKILEAMENCARTIRAIKSPNTNQKG